MLCTHTDYVITTTMCHYHNCHVITTTQSCLSSFRNKLILFIKVDKADISCKHFSLACVCVFKQMHLLVKIYISKGCENQFQIENTNSISHYIQL